MGSTTKIGRNDLCPCGSGKKYKKCHLNSSSQTSDADEEMLDDTHIDVFEKFIRTEKLRQFAALQLEPRNHGKNIRLERLVFNAIKSPSSANQELPYQELKDIFEGHYTIDYLEDPIDNFHTENIVFFGGNYLVYPGIIESGAQILNTFLEGIFSKGDALPDNFKLRIYNATRFLLEISNLMAERCSHTRFQTGNERESQKIQVPLEGQFNTLKNAVTFTQSDINRIIQSIEIPANTIEEFLSNPAYLVDEYHGDDLSLLNRPIYQDGNNYIIIVPTGIVQAIINYIKSTAIELGCTKELLNSFYEWEWKKIVEYAYEMSWKLTDIKLPPTKLNVTEGIFQFDADKLGYICLIRTPLEIDNKNISDEELEEKVENEQESNNYKERENEVIAHLNQLNQEEYRYFTLYILGSIGEMFFFSWNKPQLGNQILAFSFTDFQKIIFAGDLDELSLWKFAKAYSVASEATQFSPLTGLLNTYVAYKENEGSLLSTDEAAADFVLIDFGMATDFSRKAIAKRDEHAAPKWHEGAIAHVLVKKHTNYAPVYIERELSLSSRLLVESYSCSIWIVNNQAKTIGEKKALNDFVEATAFWLFKLTPYINKYVNQLGIDPVEIIVQVDRAFIDGPQTFELEKVEEDDIKINLLVKGRTLFVDIPHKISHLLILEHNAGERLIMKCVLSGISQLLTKDGFQSINAEEIDEVLNAVVPLGQAKMILFVDVSKDARLRNADLLSTRYIQEVETAFILDNLVKNLNLSSTIPKELATPKEKTTLCGKVVSTLISQVEHKLQQFDSTELLRWLIMYNERYVFNREYREIVIPAKIACFSDFPSEVEALARRGNELVASSLSIRCLIEFVAASPQFGTKEINLDDLDELFALMNEICKWGVISDIIHYGMSNPQMGLLPSGRIGFSREFFNDFMKPFQDAWAENEVYDFVSSFEERMRIVDNKEVSNTAKRQEVDEAFISEYNISLTKIMHILGEAMNIGILQNESVCIMNEQSLINKLVDNSVGLSESEIITGLQILSLEKRDSISKPPIGFEKEEIFPWRYNRTLSYIRRPLIKLLYPDGTINYYWGFRHVMAARENLRALLFSGRLKTKEGTLLERLVDKINTEKGHKFRKEVFTHLKQETTLSIVDYEVTISPNGHLKAERDYGDIDVMAIDDKNKIIYSIECKNTVSARIPHEMKTEIDKYLGREGNPGTIQKHVERNIWLQANKVKAQEFIESKEAYLIKSIVLTTDEIPLIYLAKETLPLPVISFKSLKRKGIQILQSAPFL